jgi:cold shock protein
MSEFEGLIVVGSPGRRGAFAASLGINTIPALAGKQRNKGRKMLLGSWKFFNPEKGYGFVAGDDGTDYFVGRGEFGKSGIGSVNPADRVSFHPRQDRSGKGPIAFGLKAALGEAA